MRILIDARFYGLENAGLGRYTQNLVESLKALDKKNTYVILLREKYFNLLKFPKNWKKYLLELNHYSVKEQIKLNSAIESINPDLVHFPHFNLPLRIKKNFIVTIHDLLMHKFKGRESTNLNPLIYPIKRLAYYLVFSNAVKKAKKIIVPSIFVKQDLLKVYKVSPSKIQVIYEGIEDKFSKKTASKEKVLGRYKIKGDYFIYTGNAYPHKNIPRVIKAMVKLNEKKQNKISLLISTSRSIFTNRLEKLIEEEGAKDYVKFLGFVPDEDLAVLYKASLGFVYASLSEGFGLQGLEVMASEGIVLASDISVFREIYKDNAIYFNPKSINKIMEAMKMVIGLEDAEKKKRIHRSQEFIKRYSWNKMVKETVRVYEKIGL